MVSEGERQSMLMCGRGFIYIVEVTNMLAKASPGACGAQEEARWHVMGWMTHMGQG